MRRERTLAPLTPGPWPPTERLALIPLSFDTIMTCSDEGGDGGEVGMPRLAPMMEPSVMIMLS